MGGLSHGLGSGGDFGHHQNDDPTSTPDGVGEPNVPEEEIDLEQLHAALNAIMRDAEEKIEEEGGIEPTGELDSPFDLSEDEASEDMSGFFGSLRPMRILLNGHDLCELYDRGLITTNEVRSIIARDYPEIDGEDALL